MNKRATPKEGIYVIIIFLLICTLGLMRHRITRDRYKIYIAHIVADKIEASLLKFHKENVSYTLLEDTLITDYNNFRNAFSEKLPEIDFREFLYHAGKNNYHIRIITKDRKATEIVRRTE